PPNLRPYPVLRRSADYAGIGTSAQGVTILGIPSAALARMYWREDFSSTPHHRLGQELAKDGPASLHGVLLPRDAMTLSAHFQLRGAPLHVDLALEDARGRIEILQLGRVGAGETTLTAQLPRPSHR